MARSSNSRSAVGLLLMVVAAYCAWWYGLQPGLAQGIIASTVITLTILGCHLTSLRLKTPPDSVATQQVDSEQVRKSHNLLIDEGRYALLLSPQVAGGLPAEHFAAARQRLESAAALVPSGHVEQGPRVLAHDYDGTPPSLIHVPSFWIDRHTVTNREFQRFVAAGGYSQAALWELDVQPLVARFLDRTGQPGPAFWRDGTYLSGTDDLPVVGVSWYEAQAFARWVGKTLPSDAQWLRIASWPGTLESATTGSQHVARHHYPWGDVYEAGRANLSPGGCGQIVAVSEYSAGSSSNGVNQLLGNVWEWTSDEFEHSSSEVAERRNLSKAGQISVSLKITRGGAYDTELDGQFAAELIRAACPLTRAPNIGFRCALGWSEILPGGALAGYHPPPSATWLKPENPLHIRVRQELAAGHNPKCDLLRQENDAADESVECAQAESSDCGPKYLSAD